MILGFTSCDPTRLPNLSGLKLGQNVSLVDNAQWLPTGPRRSRFRRRGRSTFLFTDIEGSTRKAHELGEDWFDVLQAHHDVLRPVFAAYGGLEVSTAGDSFFLVFPMPRTPSKRRSRCSGPLPPTTGRPAHRSRCGWACTPAWRGFRDNDYAGLTVHAASRVESAAAGAQVLVTQATLDAAEPSLSDDIGVLDLGFHRLKDLPSELRIYQVVADGLEREFPVGARHRRGAQQRAGSAVELRRTAPLCSHACTRCSTKTGSSRSSAPGGTGKTRVSLRLASERLHRHADGVWFVELDGCTTTLGVVDRDRARFSA